jgi:hypothetical protein
MAKYPNVYYTLDFTTTFRLAPGVSLYPADAGLNNSASFLAGIKRIGTDAIVERNVKDLTSLVQKYSDRIFWGTDMDAAWHFEDAVMDTIAGISRRIIGQLPAGIKEKYAYQNARNVFGRFLTSKP